VIKAHAYTLNTMYKEIEFMDFSIVIQINKAIVYLLMAYIMYVHSIYFKVSF